MRFINIKYTANYIDNIISLNYDNNIEYNKLINNKTDKDCDENSKKIFYFMIECIELIGLATLDLVYSTIYLERFSKTTKKLITNKEVLYSFYLSQTLTYDEPLMKEIWIKLSDQKEYSKFIGNTMNFFKVINYHIYFEKEEYENICTIITK